MPIYEYRCEQCGHEFDALQKIADAPLIDCPACGVAALKKKLSAPAFRLKGTGWYETDFKQGDKRNVHATDKNNNGGDSGSANNKLSGDGDNKTAPPPAANKTDTAAQSESKIKAAATASNSSTTTADL
ncbi:zinc ribbon domain-containing protein [Rhodoferax sp. 4810]|uniref:Zinc ribbon domain-containing protein n=1 Tax=Thiospirillum jenense TaxID=1653858 RepID=A0A839HF04_9GAMM|nr:zinc ribbon domain-containing protein [Thiospirillum jenense]MBB1073942.1 zinc ribbon domain-containing protein [Rhodoferax jenense]MBB1125818.1 zinc ribbon domain-containing protein [Thiospirillum jenense]